MDTPRAKCNLRLKKLFSAADARALILFNGDAAGGPDPNFLYFSGSAIDGSAFIAKRGGSAAFFTSSMNIARARAEGNWKTEEYGKDAYATMRKFLSGSRKVAVDMRALSAFRFANMKKKLRMRMANASEQMGQVRSFKDNDELAMMKKAVIAGRKILDELEPSEYSTEKDLHDALLIKAIEAGGSASFDPIVATGKNSSFPHHISTSKRLSGIVLVDFGVKIDGYCSDLTRCYFLGACKNEKEAYSKAQQVFYGIKDELASMRTGREVSEFAAKLHKRQGLPPLIHSIGHGIGLEVHEMPHLYSRSKDKIGDGTVLAIEPGAYYTSFGVRYEDELYLKNGKARMF
jgi:Xaa-Pro aminopeptidase